MFYLMLAINSFLLISLGVLNFNKKQYLMVLLYAWFFVLVVVKPYMLKEYDLMIDFMKEFYIDEDSYDLYQVISFLFICVFSVTTFIINRVLKRGMAIKSARIAGELPNLVLFLLSLFVYLMVYIANTVKFSDYFYIFNDVNRFQAMMALANDSWFLNVIVGFAPIGSILLIASSLRRSKIVIVMVVIAGFALLHVIGAPSVRVPYLALMLSLGFVYVARRNIKLSFIKVSFVGLVAINLLYVTNLVRTGNIDKIEEYSILRSFKSLSSDLSPVENAHYLLTNNSEIEDFKFEPLIYSILPTVLIPRKIWPDKPNYDVQAYVTEVLFGKGFYNNSTLTYTIPVMGYFNYGMVGVVAASIIYSMAINFFMALSINSRPVIGFFGAYLALYFISALRTSIENIVMLSWVYGVVFMLLVSASLVVKEVMKLSRNSIIANDK